MANIAAILANRGHWFTPHVVKSIGDDHFVPDEFRFKHQTMIDRMYFDSVIAGMARVCIPGGTAGRTGIEGIEICGKTGTAQNPHGEDHSIFIAFAPRINPKIAICVIVENGGFGADYAAPIANLMIERYLSNDRKNESKKPEMLKRMMTANLTGKKLSVSDSLLMVQKQKVK